MSDFSLDLNVSDFFCAELFFFLLFGLFIKSEQQVKVTLFNAKCSRGGPTNHRDEEILSYLYGGMSM